MRLLFLTYDFYPNFSANSSIINNLSQAFIYLGHEVDVLPLKPCKDLKEEEIWNNIKIYRINHTFDKSQVKEYLSHHDFHSALHLVFALFKDRSNHKEYLKRHWSYYPLKRFQEILTQRGYHIVVNVCYPFESCLTIMEYLEKQDKSFGWIMYMQDPFASNYYYRSKYAKNELDEIQTKAFMMADKIIVTTPILKEIVNQPLVIPIQKLKALNFPIIKKPRRADIENSIIFQKNYVNCVFVGKFNRDTRNPDKLFHIFEQFHENRIRLHIIGEDKENWNAYLHQGFDNIFFYGTQSKEIAINAELDANILVNVGNLVSNQLPSKLLEYISTGKPIVNLYKTLDCPTLEYMERYPYSINIAEDSITPKIMQKLLYFCVHYRKINVNYRYIYKKFYDCTIDYITYEFLTICDEILNNNQQLT